MLPCYITSSFISPVMAVATLRGNHRLCSSITCTSVTGYERRLMGRLEACDPRHCSRTASSSRMVKSDGCELHAPRLCGPWVNRSALRRIASTAGAAGWLPHSRRCVTAIRAGSGIPAGTTSTRSGSVTPRAGSRARLAQQGGCRTPDDASRQSGQEVVPG